MRISLRAALVVVVASLLGLACGCPKVRGVRRDRTATGDVQYQIGDTVMTSADVVFTRDAVHLSPDQYGAYPGELAFRLVIGERGPDGGQPTFMATLWVSQVSPGDSEIDLNDERARLSAVPYLDPQVFFHGISGHVSIRALRQACDFSCPLAGSGTLSFSGVGPNGEVFSLSDGTFRAADTWYDTGECQSSD
jgi:hypothetical protein